MAYSLSSFDLSKIPVDWSAVSEDEVNQLIRGCTEDPDAQLHELVCKYIAPQQTKDDHVNDSHKPSTY